MSGHGQGFALREYSDPAGYSVASARYPAASSIEVRISHRSEVGWPATFRVGAVDADTGEHTLRLTARTDPPLQAGIALIVESDWVRIRW